MSRKQVRKDFEELYIGQNTEKLIKNYYSKKKKEMFLLFVGGIFFLSVAFFYEVQESKLSKENTVFRNEDGEGKKEIRLEVKTGDGAWQDFNIELYEKEYHPQELEEKYVKAREELLHFILGKNISLNRVTDNLNLVQEMEGWPFFLTWKSSNPEIIDSLGDITNKQIPKEGVEAELKAIFQYGDWKKEEVIKVRVYPKEEREWIFILKQKLLEQEKESRKEKEFHLPKYFQEENLQWRYEKSGSGYILAGIFLVLLPVIYFQKDREIHRRVKIRRAELQKQYPEFISKLILYMEAGMNINGAIFRIAEDYQTKRKKGKPPSYLYEEVLYVCRQYKNGLSEKDSYELLGKRCSLSCYKKLTGLLIQYLHKGGYGILENLRMEATYANEERKKQIKKQGEEMGTKLLLPMILMLGIVMVLIMIPACFSFQM